MKRRGIFHLKTDSAGVTLVELLVTVTLLILFIGASGVIVSRGFEIYLKIRERSESVQVSDMILDKIASELEGALKDSSSSVRITDGGRGIDFTNADGSRVLMSAGENGFLRISYPAASPYGEINWKFDEAGYFGQRIESLEFACLVPDGNVISVTVILKGDHGLYRNVRYVRCYNI